MEQTLTFKIGTRTQHVRLPAEVLLGVLEPNAVELPAAGEEERVRAALARPTGSPRLRDIVKPGETVAIVTSDVTRPMPTWKVLDRKSVV